MSLSKPRQQEGERRFFTSPKLLHLKHLVFHFLNLDPQLCKWEKAFLLVSFPHRKIQVGCKTSKEHESPVDSRQGPLLCVKGFSSHMSELPAQKVGLEEEI